MANKLSLNVRHKLVNLVLGMGIALAMLATSSAQADSSASTRRVGGHLGFALPILTLSKDPDTTLIGRDFINVGVTPGITVHLSDRWSVDFEFIAFNSWNSGTQKATFVVDPGVVYAFDHFSAGLRVATEIGAARNIGLVPIIVKGFDIGNGLSYFVELDLPVFMRDNGASMRPSLTVLFQSGIAF